MMNAHEFFLAVILGIVEGLTEFLPVSSTGHLILAGRLLHYNSSDSKVFEVVIQLGAILAVCWVYRQKFWHVATTLRSEPDSRHFVINLIIGFLPAAVVGLLAHSYIKAHLFSEHVVALALVAGGIVIILVEMMKPPAVEHDVDHLPYRTAFFIGCCQILAMIPGVSRSGATIMGAMFFGADRKTAAEFSFFLGVPTLGAAAAYDFIKSYHQLTADNILMMGVGMVAAFFSALLVIRSMIAFVSNYGFNPFACYRIALGAIWIFFLL